MVQNNLEVTGLITPLISAFKALGSEWKELFEIGLSDYLHSQTDKYYFTNTFLHRSEKVKFFDIYFPIRITYKQLTTQVTIPKDILEEYKCITIIGTAGSGKSTLIKYIFLNSLKTFDKIPILIELRHLNEYNGDLEKLIYEKILKLSAKPSEPILKRALLRGDFILLLDGYDEIVSEKKQNTNRQVEEFVDIYSNNYFIITTRPGSGIERFPRFHDFHVRNLSLEEVIQFVNLLVCDKERKSRILNTIQDPKNASYSDYLRNPLLLSMFILAYESHPEIPKKKSAFYGNVFDTLYSKHDGITKNSFPRERKTKLERDEFEIILNLFSYLTIRDGSYSYTEEYLLDKLSIVKNYTKYNFNNDELIYDLRTSISIFVKDGFEYKFPHRSMQEYFTARFISKLPSDKKEKAYKSLFAKMDETSEDSGYNLLKLCYELDSFSFTKFFIIPQLQESNQTINESSDSSLLISFFNLINPELTLENSEKIQFFIYQYQNIYNTLIEFTNAYDYCTLFEFPDQPKVKQALYEAIRKKSKTAELHSIIFDLETVENKYICKILLKHGISKIIKEYKIQTSNKIIELELEIEKQKARLDDILNI